jgi:MFS family permease
VQPPAKPSFLSRYTLALEHRDFRWVWLGSLGGQSAYWALIVARGVLILEMTGSSAMVGITTFVAMAPRFVIPPLTGYLADRFDRRRLLALSYGAQLMHVILLTALTLTDVLAVWHLIVLSTVNGGFRAGQTTITQTLIPNVVPREKLLNAIALNQLTQQGSRLVGPAFVAPALAFGDPGVAFLGSTLFYVVGLLSILMVRTRSSGGLKKGASFGASLMEAARYAWGHPQMRTLFVLVALHCAMTMAFESTLPVFNRDILGQGMAGVSYLMMGVGAGAVVSVAYVAGVRGSVARGRLLLVFGVTSGLSMVLLATTTNTTTALLAAAGMGAAQAGFMTVAGAMVQSLAPDEMRGRISGLNQINVGGTMAMVNLANGFAADAYGAPSVLAFLGLGFVAVMLASLLVRTARSFYGGAVPLPVRAER